MIAQTFYHIYNRGNNRQPIFFNRENYLFFLRKVRNHLAPHVDIVAYCLMPNHFHFLVYAKESVNSHTMTQSHSMTEAAQKPEKQESFGNDLKIMLRSYTRALNKQQNRTGSLFQQHTKVKPCEAYDRSSHTMTSSHRMTESGDPFICFHYIHQNPWKAGLVKRMENWEFSSFRDYADLKSGTLCNKGLAYELLEIPKDRNSFVEQSYSVQTLDPKSYYDLEP